jgi:hypothetical protein
MVSTVAVTLSTQKVTLPNISELYDPNFLDILVPVMDTKHVNVAPTTPLAPKNPMMDALHLTAHHAFTKNHAPAYNSTLSATLNAFQLLSSHDSERLKTRLDNAWNDDPDLTLRIIWNIRSIHNGKGERELFYQYVSP